MRLGRNGYILLSIGMHLALAALALGFSHFAPEADEKYYQVSLVELAGPAAPPAPRPNAPASPAPVAPEPEPLPESAPKPEPEPVKRISPVKKPEAAPQPAEKPKPAPEERPPAPEPAGTAGAAGPTRHIGGLAAYEAALVDEPPAVTRRALPTYPARARGRVQGRVEVSLVVDVNGNPRELKVIRAEPAGYGFEEAALEAARKTRFMPGQVRGKPVNTLVTLPFVFNIR
ncbi:MAG: TonB family protein [Deltaproteobacteria bacterium]|jgi:protein TonB|nr:TonB family protein [Deltaproteobacteria bacterium]